MIKVPLWLGSLVGIALAIAAIAFVEVFREAWRRDAHDKKMDLLRAEAFSSTASGRGLREIPDPKQMQATRKGEIQ